MTLARAMTLRITDRLDLGVFYDADAARYRDARPEVASRVTREVFARFFAHCPAIGFECDGRPIGGVIFDGTQAHIAVLPAQHGHWGLLLKPAVEWLFSLKSEVLVEVELDNEKCMRFMARSGWQRMSATGTHAMWRMRPQGGQRKTEYPWQRPQMAGRAAGVDAGRSGRGP